MKRKLSLAQETGASNWLSALPIRAKGFSLNKQEFTDALALRYGWIVKGLPEVCACGDNFDERHAMSCQKGSFISIRHDEIRDITCSQLKEVCSDVTKEPLLQPLQGEEFIYKTAKVEQEARVDISARGFWNREQKSFFDLRVFNPLALCYSGLSLDAAHAKKERDKIRKYGERIINVEQSTFTPVVFTSAGGMARQSQIFLKGWQSLWQKRGGRKKVSSRHGCDVNFLSR